MTEIGVDTPWSVAWSGEMAFRVIPSRVFPGMMEVDQKQAIGEGEPVFAVVHATRQRQGMAGFICHVCGRPTWPDNRYIFPAASGGMVTLQDGTQGIGEAAPFPEVGGEDRTSCLAAAKGLASALIGQSVGDYQDLADRLTEQAPLFPAARCGLETAILDAYCRTQRIPLWQLWGQADVRKRETDITIPICDMEKTVALSRGWYAQGFRLFKMKVGTDAEEDIRRYRPCTRYFPVSASSATAIRGFPERTASVSPAE